MAAGGLVPSQTYKDLAACADNTAVLYLSGDGWYVCMVGAQSTSEPKVQDRPKPSRGSGLNTSWDTTPK